MKSPFSKRLHSTNKCSNSRVPLQRVRCNYKYEVRLHVDVAKRVEKENFISITIHLMTFCGDKCSLLVWLPDWPAGVSPSVPPLEIDLLHSEVDLLKTAWHQLPSV